ncbi:MAG: SDR family NAD(P)-dependent oxidoreductase, partial [Steroidobacteraceae bacterium]
MTERFALVTGGSAGIGAAICRRFLDAGYQVISLARRAAAPRERRLHVFQVDLSDAAATREM